MFQRPRLWNCNGQYLLSSKTPVTNRPTKRQVTSSFPLPAGVLWATPEWQMVRKNKRCPMWSSNTVLETYIWGRVIGSRNLFTNKFIPIISPKFAGFIIYMYICMYNYSQGLERLWMSLWHKSIRAKNGGPQGPGFQISRPSTWAMKNGANEWRYTTSI